ncbi:YhcN/YlaJ family sporulation lipoprotein [Paenibacillus sp. HJGM_3]|uniref:YhcN/YlaJ family sporulation lipoprotein n=1 Tax=Paenibacillus sp. HJGM_3 TaxID=3379816 RepID=UPI00385CBAA3
MTNNGKKAALVSVLAAGMVFGAVGCGKMPAREGTGTNDTVKTRMLTNNYRPFNYGTGNHRDLRLGYDRYRGTDPDLIRDAGDLKLGLNRDNGFTGYDRDGVNNWRDYKAANRGHNITSFETNEQLAKEITSMGPVEWASVMHAGNSAYVAVKLKHGADLEATGHVKTQIADKVHTARPEVQNVYVSSNPDLVGRFQQYGEEIRQGRPVSGLVNEFSTLVQKVFPTNASYGTNEAYNQPGRYGIHGTDGVSGDGMHGTKTAPATP